MSKRTQITRFALACFGLALPMTADAGTIASGFSATTMNNLGTLPWGSHVDHGTEWYCITNSFGNPSVTMNSGVLQLNAVHIVANGLNYQSGVVYGKTQVPGGGYSYITVDVDIYAPQAGTRGLWPAFWIDSAWNWPPEVDIAEFKGNIGGGNVWQNAIGSSGAWKTVITTVDKTKWHHYGLAMSSVSNGVRSYQLFLDSVLKNSGTFPDAQGGVPFWVIANFATEGDSGAPGPTSDSYVQMKNYVLATH
jgi:hypothetical protein